MATSFWESIPTTLAEDPDPEYLKICTAAKVLPALYRDASPTISLTRYLHQYTRYFAANPLISVMRCVGPEGIWTMRQEIIAPQQWPRIIVFRPSCMNAQHMLVKVYSWKMGPLWDVFFDPDMAPEGCFTGLIPAGCETRTLNADFILFQEPETFTATAYRLPPDSDWKDVVAKEWK